MDEEFHGHGEHHDGSSDATPGGYEDSRRPGELAFAIFLLLASGYLLKEAYGISGFEALSGPGVVPMGTTAVMLITALIAVLTTWRRPLLTTETIAKDILPLRVIVFVVLIVSYGLLLKPVGFLPTSAIFLILAIKFLDPRSWLFATAVALFSLILVWFVFRIIFTVLMPAGIVPEAEMVQALRDLFGGAK
ncbi:tripartite tricarboxylate transporter TctB family protein [Defluviimonas sp. SAOS-178_SWC]|uniref:tripartite tricarboxylate transporter TctB family protein n=1 Tax=Defluviimonas sp. SAOS-178_SWC TaxID=3121287 RepID=UPI00322176A6